MTRVKGGSKPEEQENLQKQLGSTSDSFKRFCNMYFWC